MSVKSIEFDNPLRLFLTQIRCDILMIESTENVFSLMPFDSNLIKDIEDFHRHKETCTVLIVNCLPTYSFNRKWIFTFSPFLFRRWELGQIELNVSRFYVIDYYYCEVVWHKHNCYWFLHVKVGITHMKLTRMYKASISRWSSGFSTDLGPDSMQKFLYRIHDQTSSVILLHLINWNNRLSFVMGDKFWFHSKDSLFS